LRDISSKNPEVSLLDMERLINGYAAKGIPGFDLFLDYVHPTREGNMVIAREAASLIAENELLSTGRNVPAPGLKEVQELTSSGYRDDEDMFLQFTRFSLCCMTHQYYSALHFGRDLQERLPRESLENDPTGRMTILRDAVTVFQAYEDMEQRSLVEEITPKEEKKVMDDIRAFYARHFPYGAF
jgi:hypothetical protein